MAISPNLAVAADSLALDPKGVESLRRVARSDSTAGARVVAQQFEALLMQQMLNSMRSANQGFGEENNSASSLFRSMQDQQFAQLTALKGGAGLADAIVRQIAAQRSTLTSRQANTSSTESNKASATGPAAKSAAQTMPAVPAKAAASTAAPAGDFVGQLSASAENAAAQLGVSPRVLLAQAALETGWGKRVIRNADGSDSHNLFGIKAGSSWGGKTTDVTTTEYVAGKAQKRVEKFRAYDSYAEAFSDYADLIKRRYGNAVGAGNNAAGFGQALQAGGYATDPQYASKIAKVAERVSARQAARQTGSSQLA